MQSINLSTDQKWGLGIVLLLVFILFAGGRQESPDDDPEPDELAGVSALNEAFTGTDRSTKQVRHDADRLSDICLQTAEVIDYDGKVEMRFKSGSHINDCRTQLRRYCEKGGSFVALYPNLAPALDQFFTSRVGVDDNELTEASRRSWIKAYRDLARSLAKTAQTYEAPK